MPPQEPESIGVQFHGTVSGMTAGSAEIRRSLMPTFLEWLAARQSLLLLWIGSSTAIGIIARLLKFLRIGL
jgi:hypothetical protein